MSAQSEAPVGPTAKTSITLRRSLDIERAGGMQHWTLNEFDHGRSFMLVCNTGTTQCEMHFDAEAWAAFQRLIELRPLAVAPEELWESAKQAARDHAANLTGKHDQEVQDTKGDER